MAQSNEVFPQLQGLGWDLGTTPIWSTDVQTSRAMREVRISYASAPVYDITLQYEFLAAGAQRGDPVRTDLDVLSDFYYGRRGRAQSFLFRHWYDYALLHELLGTADGTQTTWQIGRWRDGGWEPMRWIDTSQPISIGPLMWTAPARPMWSSSGTTPMWSTATLPDYSISNGEITFMAPPAAGTEIHITAQFYYRARFLDDDLKIKNFLRGFWAGGLTLRACTGDKL